MKIEAKIILKCENEKKAKAIANAVSPDNIKYPELSLRTFNNGCRVITLVGCRGKIGTFIITVDDLLRCLIVAEKTVNLVKETQ